MIKNTWTFPQKLLAHRGCGTLYPENTLVAIQHGFKQYGYNAVEFDVMLSKDSVPMLMHDEVLDRTVRNTVHQGKVFNQLDASELKQVNAGLWFNEKYPHLDLNKLETVCIPTFESVLEFCSSNDIWMNIEIKPVKGMEKETGKAVAELTAKYFPVDTKLTLPLFSSFSYDAMLAAMDAAPYIPRAYLMKSVKEDSEWATKLKVLKAVSLNCDHICLTKDIVQEVKNDGLYNLFCYTVNCIERAQELKAWGVDAICTDRVDLFTKY